MSKQWQQKSNKAAAPTPKNKPAPVISAPSSENLWASMYSKPAPEAQPQPQPAKSNLSAKNSKDFKPNSSQAKKNQQAMQDDAIVSIEDSKPPTFSNKNKQKKKAGDAIDGFTGDANKDQVKKVGKERTLEKTKNSWLTGGGEGTSIGMNLNDLENDK